MANTRNDESVVRSSGNVFADLELRDAGEKQTKVRLALAIRQIIQARRLSQSAAAQLLDVNQPKISARRQAGHAREKSPVGRQANTSAIKPHTAMPAI